MRADEGKHSWLMGRCNLRGQSLQITRLTRPFQVGRAGEKSPALGRSRPTEQRRIPRFRQRYLDGKNSQDGFSRGPLCPLHQAG